MIPDYQAIMRPVLELLADGQVRRAREVRLAMADHFGLTAEERAEMLPSGRQPTMDNRVGWALSHLAQAGLTERPSRGSVTITHTGRDALAKHPVINSRTLEEYPGFIAFRNRTRAPRDLAETETVPTSVPSMEASSTPSDLLDLARRTNDAAVRGEVLKAGLDLTSYGFENLVIKLLEKMGYGRLGSVERTSATGDAGVDGIISQDPLGLDRIYVQAKRYAEDRPVDRPKIHEFAGALLGKQGDRGVLITTSRFTEGARLEAERINARIELIDGERMAELLVQYGVGVQPEETVTLYRLDEDFFETL